MLYLVDAGKGPELSNVSSVSGGSLTNGYIGLKADLTTVTPDQFRDAVRPLARQIVARGTLFAYVPTYLLLGVVALIAVPTLLASLFLCPGAISLALVLVAALVCGWIAQRRSAVAAKSFDSTLFHGARLEAMHDSVSHVLCATELQTGLAAFFGGSFVYNYKCGWGTPGDLPLARAVQASAALPGAFNVVSLPTDRHRFPKNPFTRFKLTDGGVYDNMGTEWPMDLSERLSRTEGGTPPSLPGANELIVVNSSGGWRDVVQRKGINAPLVGEISTLLAVKDVMYDQTTSVRRRLLHLRFKTASTSDPHSLRGVTVQIDRSPYDLPQAFRDGTDAAADRAREVIRRLGDNDGDRKAWADVVVANKGTKTTLSKVAPGRAVALMRHAYVLTMVNCHVLLEYPLRAVPDDTWFRDLIS